MTYFHEVSKNMLTRRVLIPVLAIVVVLAVAATVYLATNSPDTTYEFVVRDAVSKKLGVGCYL